jgi:hypothetical protein
VVLVPLVTFTTRSSSCPLRQMFFAERATRSAPRRSMLLNVVKAKRHESDLTPQLLADIVFSVKRPPSADCAVVETTDFFRRALA